MPERRRSNLPVVYLSVILCFFCGSLWAQVLEEAVVPSRITSPVDNAVRVTIARSTHPQAQARFDRGPLEPSSPMERMIMVLGASPEQEQQLRTFLDSQQTKGSPEYRHWLTPAEFGKKFGPSPQDIQQVTGWLQQQGFSVGSAAKSGRWIEFSGTAAQVNRAFQTQMRSYQVAGETHLANASDISIPAALAPVVRGVSLHNFFKKPMHTQGQKVTLSPDATLHDSLGNVVHALAPGDFALIYDLGPLYTGGENGAGQTIAIVARSDIDPTDIGAFRSQFATGNSVNSILNGPDPGLVPGDQDEATLDSEWSTAVAPGATIDLVISSSTATTDGVDLSAAYIVDNNLASVMSASFSQCEQLLGAQEDTFINGLWEQAAAQGISVFVAAGDDGAAGCDDPNTSLATGGLAVNGLASTPFNTAVGGTEFDESLGGGDATFWNTTNTTTLVSVKGYIPEMVWNESCSATKCGLAGANLFAGSGGLSTLYATPTWQQLTIPGLPQPMRALPDVSLTAAGHDGYLVCLQGSCQQGIFFVFGGTSASSPSFAGIMAIIDQKTGGRQGLPNYVLYSLAAKENFANCNSSNRTNPLVGTSCVFNDSTVGNNSVPGQTGFNAVAGYDLATGLGSVDANNLVTAYANAAGGFQNTTTTLAANPAQNPITIAHGTSLNFNVGVTRAGTTGTPSGTISLIASGGNLTGALGVAATTISGSNGTANGTFTGISNLPGGTAYNLMARYPGDGTFGASDSSTLTVTVTPENSTTTLNSIIGFDSFGNPIFGTNIAYGSFLDLRTVVASATNTSPPDGFPSGMIALQDNGSPLGTLNLNSQGQAELINCITPTPPSPTPCLAPGSHPITAAYGGDNGFNLSGPTAATTITVTKATPKVVLSSAQLTIASGQAVNLMVQFQIGNGALPSGNIQFFDGTTLIGANNAGSPFLQATLTTQGVHNLSAQYLGDSNYNPATSNVVMVTVTAPFNFTATTTSQTIAAGGTATYNLTLNDITGFAGSVSLACTGGPGGSTCTDSPNPVTLTATTTSVPLTVTVSNTASARLAPAPFKTWPFVVAGVLVGLLWGTRKRTGRALLILGVLGVVLGIGSCGGGSPPPRPPTVATLTVTATSGQFTSNITLNLTITH